MITRASLIALGVSKKLAAIYQEPLNRLTQENEINTPLRVSHFLAQILHESGMLIYNKEIWGKKPTKDQAGYERDFSKKWDKGQKAFRLGNDAKGDGRRYSGYGLIQITGKYNISLYAKERGVDYITHPEWLARTEDSVAVAVWYWKKNNINAICSIDGIVAVTKKINPGLRGLSDRERLFKKCLSIFSPELVMDEKNKELK